MIGLRGAEASDRFRMRRWLDDPALPAWWASKSSVEAEIAVALEAHNPYLCIVEDGADAIGLAIASDAAQWSSTLPKSIEPGASALDVFVARPQTRTEDSTRAISLLAADVFATSLAIACCSLVSIKSETAARAYENAGFTWSEIWHDRYRGPCWVMQRARPR